MNWFDRLRKTRLVAIKNFDDELYRLVKVYASLEGRTIASIFEEAIRTWVEGRRDYEEVKLWVSLEEAYKGNLKVFEENRSSIEERYGEGYVVICDGRLVGVFKDYHEALRKSSGKCRVHTLIIKLPYREVEVELGLPW